MSLSHGGPGPGAMEGKKGRWRSRRRWGGSSGNRGQIGEDNRLTAPAPRPSGQVAGAGLWILALGRAFCLLEGLPLLSGALPCQHGPGARVWGLESHLPPPPRPLPVAPSLTWTLKRSHIRSLLGEDAGAADTPGLEGWRRSGSLHGPRSTSPSCPVRRLLSSVPSWLQSPLRPHSLILQ